MQKHVHFQWDHSFGFVVFPAVDSSGKSAFEQRFVDDTKPDGFSEFSFAAWILCIVKAGDEINVSLQDS